MKTFSSKQQHDAGQFVRDRAPYQSEGPRRILAGGPAGCVLEYEVATIDHRYALKYGLEFPGYAGTFTCWTAFPSRAAAIEHLVTECCRVCQRELDIRHSAASQRNRAGAAAMLDILQPQSLFGFQEPPAPPRSAWYDDMLADRLHFLTLRQNWRLLDVVRGGDYKPMSPTGSFFDIPVP